MVSESSAANYHRPRQRNRHRPDLGTADAYATAVFVMGVDGLDWIENQPGSGASTITHERTAHWTTGFPRSKFEVHSRVRQSVVTATVFGV